MQIEYWYWYWVSVIGILKAEKVWEMVTQYETKPAFVKKTLFIKYFGKSSLNLRK
jgi:hypothetical protein